MEIHWRATDTNGQKALRRDTAVESVRDFLATHKSRKFRVREERNGRHEMRFTLTGTGLLEEAGTCASLEFTSRGEAVAWLAKQEA